MLRRVVQDVVCGGRQMVFTRNLVIPSFKTVNIELPKDQETAILTMKRPPTNSLNLQLLTDLNQAIQTLESKNMCRGIILTSSQRHIFTSGLDVKEMYQPNKKRLRTYFNALQDIWTTLYETELITIAAVNGICPAGGCFLVLGCDYRIMANGNYKIGLNETNLGMLTPFWSQEALLNIIGFRHPELFLQLGKMYSPEEALKIKLIDKVVPEDLIINKAMEEMKKWLQIPSLPNYLTKLGGYEDSLKSATKKDAALKQLLTFTMSPAVQNSLAKYVAAT